MRLAGDLASFGGEANFPASFDADKAIFFEATKGHGHGGRRDFQQLRETRGDDRFAFGLGFEDGLEVVLLGDGDHCGVIILRGVKRS